MRKDLPVFDGPRILAKEIGGANVRMKATASAWSTILPKELTEMN